MPTIAQNLRSARQASGLTQFRVALAMDVKERTYCRWESGETVPSVATLRRLAEVLGVSISTLIQETE